VKDAFSPFLARIVHFTQGELSTTSAKAKAGKLSYMGSECDGWPQDFISTGYWLDDTALSSQESKSGGESPLHQSKFFRARFGIHAANGRRKSNPVIQKAV